MQNKLFLLKTEIVLIIIVWKWQMSFKARKRIGSLLWSPHSDQQYFSGYILGLLLAKQLILKKVIVNALFNQSDFNEFSFN